MFERFFTEKIDDNKILGTSNHPVHIIDTYGNIKISAFNSYPGDMFKMLSSIVKLGH